MAKNKVKFNLKNVYAAIATESGGVYSYAQPKAIPGAVSMSLDAEGESNPFYADGIVYFRTVVNNGYSGDLEIAMVPEWFREEVLQESKDTNGVFVENANITDPVHFALLFEFNGDQKSIRHVLYNCSVSQRPSIASQTKEASVEPVTETLNLSADPREDGLIKARSGSDTDSTVYNNWYNAVYVPGSAVQSYAKLSALSITGVTLVPAFNANVYAYTADTTAASNVLTATAADSATATIMVNGASHTSGNAASWEAGDNLVVITVSKDGMLATAYTIAVDKS